MLSIDPVSTTLVRLTMDRPPANALSHDLVKALRDAFLRLGEEAGAPAIILTAAGDRFFSAGGDIREVATDHSVAVPRMHSFHEMLVAIERYPRPVLCAVNGYAVGGAMELLLHSDYVVASDTARFGFPEINHGLLPAAKGIRQAVNRLGRRAAERLLYSGELISSEKARDIGLVDVVVAPDELQGHVRAQADRMRSKDMHLFAAIKATLNHAAMETDTELETRSIEDMKLYLNREEAAAAREQFLQRKAT
ncbi:enoyl-CoA hydratase [Sphingomonas sp. Root710]|uniref:enoyl-CoA hydratase/isomerase family protein n=1 Tax=Sphingomonas sp. Root710 TaxID=1736594 RepID=UPI0007009A81|nr:enoyl-CoA hydratase/isomerase family protein [Sphingomonas sp. Root710]KRB85292.1 enoyl-CoA hydratase [Sphingomonas sp. Root710]